MKNRLRVFNSAMMLAVIAAMLMTPIAAADDGQPPPDNFFYINEDGQIAMNRQVLAFVGEVRTPPPDNSGFYYHEYKIDWLHIDWKIGEMKYNKYVTPEGYYVLVPSGYTSYVLARTNTDPFNAEPDGLIVTPLMSIPTLFGMYKDTGLPYTAEDVFAGWKDKSLDAESVRDLIHALVNPFDDSLNESTIVMVGGVFIYKNDPTMPEVADVPPPPQPPPSARACPAPTIVQDEMRVIGELIDPPFPVVVGQDRQRKRGADLMWRVEIPPVIYTWYEERAVNSERICRYVGKGNGSGCPGPGSQYKEVIGSEVGWKAWMIGDDEWRAEGKKPEIECIKHVEVYTEKLNWVKTTLSLSQHSRDWILEDLARRYPGAYLYQPEWSFLPLSRAGRVLGDGTFVFEWTKDKVQLRDPGEYEMAVRGGRSGTPVTKCKFFNEHAGDFAVWMQEATLVK